MKLLLLPLLFLSFAAGSQTVYNASNFSVGTGFTGSASQTNVIVAQPDGKLLVGGTFSQYQGVPAKGICRLNADGTIDNTFHLNLSSVQTDVYAISLQSDGKILVGGYFDEWDGAPSQSFVRLNPDGTTDLTFASGTGVGFHPNYAHREVDHISIQSDGKILLSGWFGSWDGVPRINIARINSDGSLDAGFDPGQYFGLVNAGATIPRIFTTNLDLNGEILVGGEFNEFNGEAVQGFIRLHSDGSHDLSFNPVFSYGLNIMFTPGVKETAVQPNGKIIISGAFAMLNGENCVMMARLNPDGSTDNTFRWGDATTSNSLGLVIPQRIVVQNDGKIIIAGGGFTTSEDRPYFDIARLMPDGKLDYGFNLDELGAPANYTARINDVCSLTDSTMVIAGRFITVQGDPRRNIAKLDACGTFSLLEEYNCGNYLWSGDGQVYNMTGAYFATHPSQTGCDSVAVLKLRVAIAEAPVELCVVGLDSISNNNRIVWEKPETTGLSGFNVYRETSTAGNYTLIGSTTYADPGILVDASSNPAVQAFRYVLAAVDTCGRETVTSQPHKTVHLTINQGQGASWNLIWTPYEGYAVSTYNIYRGSDPASLILLTSVSGSMTTFTDFTGSGSDFYQIEFVGPVNCDPSKSINYARVKSNIVSNEALSLTQKDLTIGVYPNPAGDQLYLNEMTSFSATSVKIYSVLGALIREQKMDNPGSAIDLTSISSGLYTLRVISNEGSVETKFVKK